MSEEQRTRILTREEVVTLIGRRTQGLWLPRRDGSIVTYDAQKREVQLGTMLRANDLALAAFAPELALTAHALYLELELAQEKARRFDAMNEGDGVWPILATVAGVGGWLTVLVSRFCQPRTLVFVGAALTVVWLAWMWSEYRRMVDAREKREKAK